MSPSSEAPTPVRSQSCLTCVHLTHDDNAVTANDSLERGYATKGPAFSSGLLLFSRYFGMKKKRLRNLILTRSSFLLLDFATDLVYHAGELILKMREQRCRAYALVSCTPGVISNVCRGNFCMAREPLANDVLSLSLSFSLSRVGTRGCRCTTRYVTSRQR